MEVSTDRIKVGLLLKELPSVTQYTITIKGVP